MAFTPDIFRFGIVGERISASASGGGPDFDLHQVEDMKLHLNTWEEHTHGAKSAFERGDPYNGIIEWLDAQISLGLAWIVASRIVDDTIREQAFAKLQEV
jgi:hypothetical protein